MIAAAENLEEFEEKISGRNGDVQASGRHASMKSSAR
jgi:hypothetical protein